MKSLANASALALALLWLIAGTCTPKPPAASPIAPSSIEAAAPQPNDDGEGDLSLPDQIPDAGKMVALDLPPDAGTEPDATAEQPNSSAVVETPPTIRQSRTVAPVYRQPVYQRRRIGWRFGR